MYNEHALLNICSNTTSCGGGTAV